MDLEDPGPSLAWPDPLRAERYRLQYKRPLSGGLAQFTGLKFTRATSGQLVLINPRDQISATYTVKLETLALLNFDES